MRDISQFLVEAVLNSLWQGAAAAAVVWLLLRCARRLNAATKYVVWWAVLAAVMVLPAVPWLAATRAAAPAPAPVARVADVTPAPVPALMAAVQSAPLPPPQEPVFPIRWTAGWWPVWICGAWLGIAAMMLARVFWSYAHLRGLKRRAQAVHGPMRVRFDEWLLSCRVERPVRLLISDELTTPVAVGFARPAVILPGNLLDEFGEVELDHVLLHELAHLARRDDWTNLAAQIIGSVLATHPLAHWLLAQIENEREAACDDWVVAMTGEARPYAASLARLFEVCSLRRRTLLAPAMAEGGSQLGERIERLMAAGRDFKPCASAPGVLLGALTLLALTAASTVAPPWIAFAQAPAAAPAPAASPSAPAPAKQAPSPKPAKPAARPAPASPASPAATPTPASQADAAAKGSFLAALVAAGYDNLSVDEIVELKIQGVSPEFIAGMRQAGWGKLPPRQLIELRVQGVSPEYLRALSDAGLKNLEIRDVIEMRVHGVQPAEVREIRALGFGPYTAREHIDLRIHGVRPDFFRALKDNGYTQVDAREAIEARIQGVRGPDLEAARKYGSKMPLTKVIQLKQSGVI